MSTVFVLLVFLIAFFSWTLFIFITKYFERLKDSDTISMDFSNPIELNCVDEACATDDNCKLLCNAGFKCLNGKCRQPITTQSPLSCNESKGFFMVRQTTFGGGSWWKCLNTLPHLYNDDETLKPYVCRGGNFNGIDVCECPPDKDLLYSNQIPLCLSLNEQVILNHV